MLIKFALRIEYEIEKTEEVLSAAFEVLTACLSYLKIDGLSNKFITELVF